MDFRPQKDKLGFLYREEGVLVSCLPLSGKSFCTWHMSLRLRAASIPLRAKQVGSMPDVRTGPVFSSLPTGSFKTYLEDSGGNLQNLDFNSQ